MIFRGAGVVVVVVMVVVAVSVEPVDDVESGVVVVIVETTVELPVVIVVTMVVVASAPKGAAPAVKAAVAAPSVKSTPNSAPSKAFFRLPACLISTPSREVSPRGVAAISSIETSPSVLGSHLGDVTAR